MGADASQALISDLRAGDLVQTGGLTYEPVLGWLHQLRASNNVFLTVLHSAGEFRATANHLVFVADGNDRVSKALGDLRVGDQIFINPSAAPSMILSVCESKSSIGMFAPFTASGTVVVDGVVASIYGQPSMYGKLTHGSAHAAFFPVRAYHALGLASVFGHAQNHEVHPFAE